MSAQAVNTLMKRFTFVKKTAEQVGDGTAWPMLVTLDQLAEIEYRVRDAWFTSGLLSSPYITMSFHGGLGAAAAKEYDDISEVGMWYPYVNQLNTGCSHQLNQVVYLNDELPPPPPDVYTILVPGWPLGIGDEEPEYALSASVDFGHFGRKVAFVGDNPLDPTAKIYLSVRFFVDGYIYVDTYKDYWGDDFSSYDTGVRFVIRLANGASVSCKIYSEPGDITGTDIVLEATKWWPYAGPNGPIWDADTGLKL